MDAAFLDTTSNHLEANGQSYIQKENNHAGSHTLMVEQYLLKHDYLKVLNDANRIFNIYESSFEMAPSPQKKRVFAKRGMYEHLNFSITSI